MVVTLKDKVALYQNCTIFDNPELYGGPICDDNRVTYVNSLYLDCKNYHSRDTGKLISIYRSIKINNDIAIQIKEYTPH